MIVYAIFACFTSDILTGIALVFSTILVSLVIIDLVRNEKDFYTIIDCIIFSSFILSIIGIVEALSKQYIFQEKLLPVHQNMRYGILRATGPFGICINFGLYQAICAILIFYKITYEKNLSKLFKYKIAYFFVVISIFMSVSRLAICLFIATHILFYFQLGIDKAINKFLIIILSIPVLFVFLDVIGLSVIELLSDFFVSTFKLIGINIGNESTDVIGFGNRTDLYKWVFDAMNGNFIFGMGIDAKFEFKMNSLFTKTSIEVHYL